ncbi:MAG TPA: DUF4332 domain-containing protein [Cyanobium sp.]|nr:DUF4332 domain-containing protein [Cyanobium sp.]
MSGLGPLPPHFAREAARLRQAGIDSWSALASLPDRQLRELGEAGGASEARLLRLRAQAQLMVAVELSAAEASLLLLAGIATAAGLGQADPQRLERQVGRLQRQLLGRAAPPIDGVLLREWIRRARQSSGRPGN